MSIDTGQRTGQEFGGLAAVVTGGASGIGAATVRQLLAGGASVAVLDLDPSGAPQGSLGIACDISDAASVQAAVAEAVVQLDRQGSGLDVVVANAGIGAQGDVAANDDAEWARVLDVNVVGTARTVRAALPHLRRAVAAHGQASVVVTCSIAAWTGLPNRVLYSATKGALQAMVLAMAADFVGEQIRVNGVNPGTADTPWVARLLDAADDPAAERTALEARQPTGRLVPADDVARAICYLASPLSGSTTGTMLGVDGGMHGLRTRGRG